MRTLKFLALFFIASSCSLLISMSSIKDERTLDEQFLDFLEERNLVDAQNALENGADINAKNFDFSSTALLYYADDEVMVNFLLKNGANANLSDDYLGLTPLMVAAMQGSRKIVKKLLAHNALIDQKDKEDHTALYHAIENDQTKLAKILLQQGASFTINNYTNLDFALRNSKKVFTCMKKIYRKNLIRSLAQDKNNLNALQNGEVLPSLIVVMKWFRKDSKFIQWLLDSGVDINITSENDSIPLHYAIYYNSKILQQIIYKTKNINHKSNTCTALFKALMFRQYDAALSLIRSGAHLDNINEDDMLNRTSKNKKQLQLIATLEKMRLQELKTKKNLYTFSRAKDLIFLY